MKSAMYKSYEIRPAPMKIKDEDRWTLNVYICRETGKQRTERPYSATDTFPTKEEAIVHCFNFAKQIIDGKVPGCSVIGL